MAHWTAERWKQLSPLLDQALELEPAERARFLNDLRSNQPEWADELSTLLERSAQAEAAEFMHRGPTLSSAEPTLAGQQMGAYVLTQPLGYGGMGSVWLAQRNDGRYEGHAAIKLLNLSLVGRSSAERFRREGTILATLKHPNIAQLIDAGISGAGQPYLVLEYVAGQSIDLYCDAHRLSVRQRIDLFLKVLDGVSHAHSHLVVHRDIKPSNVMVTQDGQVKLLDFGIAKLLQDDADSGGGGEQGTTALTRLGANPLTPDYAAPEQIEGAPITTATDVYALGVMLYVLLSGKHPTAGHAASSAMALKAVLEDTPRKLSDAVTQSRDTTADDASALAERRTTTPKRLVSLVSGDLDNILAKALKKVPAERYKTVNEFAEDLQRHLKFEPVKACADSFLYRVRRFVRRNRVAALAAMAVAVAVAGGVVSTAWQAKQAAQEARRANNVREFVESIFAPIGEGLVEQKQPSLKVLVEKSVAELKGNNSLGPEERIDLLLIFARLQNKLEARDAALALIDEAYQVSYAKFGNTRLSTAVALAERGHIRLTKLDRVEAERDLIDAEKLFLKQGVGGENLIRLYTTLSNLSAQRKSATDALKYARLALKERLAKYAPDSPRVATGYSNLGFGLESVGDYLGAADAYDKAHRTFLLTYQADSYETAISLSQRGNARALAGDLRAGRADLLAAQQSLALHPNRSARQWLNLSRLCTIEIIANGGERAAAVCALQRHYTDQTRSVDSEDTALSLRLRALLAIEEGDLTTARRLVAAAEPALVRSGVPAWTASVTLVNAELLWLLGDTAGAQAKFAAGITQLGDGFPPHSRRNALARKALACKTAPSSEHCPTGYFEDAKRELNTQSYRTSAFVLPAQVALARVELSNADFQAAFDRLDESLAAMAAQMDATAPRLVEAKLWRVVSLFQLNRCQEGLASLESILNGNNARLTKSHPLLDTAYTQIETRTNCR
ncbi:MAG: serine/threonine protein kinase [Betaproteobacteria bacterium]|nr:MAG: serine/threonine protein kinase [Betaproteobacteria bacterium]